jgi:predicted component of type VI protein secretion system
MMPAMQLMHRISVLARLTFVLFSVQEPSSVSNYLRQYHRLPLNVVQYFRHWLQVSY